MSTHIKIKSSPQDSVLSCPICMDIYRTPRMLPCQHTLCEACLHSYIVNKSRERVLVSDFPCPVCRSITPSPQAFTRIDTWASHFPLNRLLVSLLDNENTILTMDKGIDETATEKCSEHSGKHIEFFCTEHNLSICSKCFKNNHRQCDVIDIEDHIEFTSRSGVVRKDLRNLNRYLEDTIAHLKSNIEQLALQKTGILNEIKDFRNKVESFLTGMERDVKDQVNLNHDGEIIVLKAQCEKYERMKTEVTASENTMDELPLSGNVAQTLDTMSVVENDVKGYGTVLDGCHENIKTVRLNLKLGTQLLGYLNSGGDTVRVYTEQFDTELAMPPDIKTEIDKSSEPPAQRMEQGNSGNDATQTSSRIKSPRSIITSRPPVSMSCPVIQRQESRDVQPITTADSMRPLTVPIENSMAVPVVVRPRAERPVIQTMPRYPFRSNTVPYSDTARSSRDKHGRKTQTVSKPEHHTNEANEKQAVPQIQSDILESLQITIIDLDPPTDVRASTEASASKTSVALGHPDTSVNGDTNSQVTETRAGIHVNNEITRLSENEVARHPATVSSGKNREIRTRSKSDSMADVNPIGVTPVDGPAKSKSLRQSHSLCEENELHVYENTTIVMQHARSEQVAVSTATKREQEQASTANTSATDIPTRALKMEDVNVHISTDAHDCTITGAAILPDARIVLVDCNNSCIKLMNKDFVFQAYCHMKKEPWNATCVTPHEIAVTIPLEKAVQIVRILGTNMTAVRCISTRRECWGIGYFDERFIVTAKDDGNSVIFLDKFGRELQVINFASQENPNILRPVSLTLNEETSLIYVSCEGQSGTMGSLVTLSMDGAILHIFTDKNLDRPYSCALDKEGYVYITGIRSSNLLRVVDGNGSQLLSRDNGLSRPQHVHMLPDSELPSFFVSERRSNTIYVYELQ